jgi:hypothetical protein
MNPTVRPLRALLEHTESLGEADAIFARPPFTLDSEAFIGHFDSESDVPDEVVSLGFAYFLGYWTIEEALEVFKGAPPTIEEKRDLLFHYGVYDGFPDWVFRR